MERLILHLGIHRAGSTSIQDLLTRRRAEFARVGITTWTRRDLLADPLRRALFSLPTSRITPLLALRTLLECDANTLAISEENLLGTMPGVDGTALYPGATRVSHTLRWLDRAFRTEARLVLRRQDHWLESIYAFRVSRGFTASFPVFVNSFRSASLSFRPLLEVLSHARFADLQVALFEDLFVGCTDWDLAAFLGLPRDVDWVTRTAAFKNQGLRGGVLNLLRAFNLERPDAKVHVRRRLVRALTPFSHRVYPLDVAELCSGLEEAELPSYIPLISGALKFAAREPDPAFSPRHRQEFLSHLREDNRQLLRRHGYIKNTHVWDD